MICEVVILELPVKEDAEKKGALERVVTGPTLVVASDEQNAAVQAVLDNADKLKEVARERMSVLVRPF